MPKKRRTEIPAVPESHTQCNQYLPQKQRFCRLDKTKDSNVCSQHTADGDRLPCPYDAKHTVPIANLAKHLKKCNSAPISESPKYYSLDANITNISTVTALGRDLLLILSPAQLTDLFAKIDTIFTSTASVIATNIKSHPSMASIIAKTGSGKHLSQQSSLLSHILSSSDSEAPTKFLEFGCGKAGLSKFLQLAMKAPSFFALIDRKKFRVQNKDRFMEDGRSIEHECVRVTVDIKDLDLDLVDGAHGECCAISKHLCGCATDYTLSALKKAVKCNVKSIVIALCCHHVCSYKAYCNPKFLETHKISEKEFAMIVSLTSWATNGPPAKQRRARVFDSRNTVENPDLIQTTQQVEGVDDEAHWSGIECWKEREVIGIRCKRVLDAGRVEMLREMGYVTMLEEYVDRSVSLENVALIARMQSRSPL